MSKVQESLKECTLQKEEKIFINAMRMKCKLIDNDIYDCNGGIKVRTCRQKRKKNFSFVLVKIMEMNSHNIQYDEGT